MPPQGNQEQRDGQRLPFTRGDGMTRTAPFKIKNKFADRGKVAEDAVAKFLKEWAAAYPWREASRLIDTKAAGRTVKAAPADFEFFCKDPEWALGANGLIEVKETQHNYRLSKDKLPQLARLRKRAKCGGLVFVLVLHSEAGLWRCMTIADLEGPSDKGSWNLSGIVICSTPQEALQTAYANLWGVQ
jgi:hypothetical protein